ncbi:unnamed protein product, partial [Mesorhabditis spiculigera]
MSKLLCRLRAGSPFGMTVVTVFFTLLVFFTNLTLIYYYVQTRSNAEFPQPVQSSHPQECQREGLGELAIKALDRVKTEECRRQIEDAACRLQNKTFHEKMPLSNCHNFDTVLAGQPIGCFLDKGANRQLKAHKYEFTDNSHAKCQSHCHRAGYLYYGLEYGVECFCGDDFAAQYEPISFRCTEYSCAGNNTEYCGGFEAVDIYRTGLIVKAAQLVRRPKYLETSRLKKEDVVKIMFVLQLNGRNTRQVRRLLKAIYSPHHFYYVHVDKRQTYMISQMRELAAKLPNLYVEMEGRSTIWGGASLLSMMMHAIRTTISIPQFGAWDFLVNLSESDFPVMTLAELETQLTLNRGNSFLASHGSNAARFIQKQGFEFVFVECEERMWRVGRREEFPRGLRIDGGSDWVILHKEFAMYSISDEELPAKLRTLFSNIILPVESFFHTLAANSIYCDQVITGNLRLTNWNRAQGCRCQSLKKVVDWCGCSPLVFTKDSMTKFELEKAKSKVYYLARKFENLIDVDAIAAAEAQAMRDRPELLSTRSPSFNTSHLNIFEAALDGYSKPYTLMALRLLAMSSQRDMEFGSLKAVHVYRAHFEANWQLVFTILTKDGQTIELLAQRSHDSFVENPAVTDGFSLKSVRMGVSIDHKEEVFRGYTGYVDQKGAPTILLLWERVPGEASTVPANKTSPAVKFEWRDEQEALVATQRLPPYDSIYGQQFAELALPSLTRLKSNQTGVWSVTVMDDNRTLGKVNFPLFDPEDEESFVGLVAKFYRVQADCLNVIDCRSSLWSTFHPDPKSDIQFGYDQSLGYLV